MEERVNQIKKQLYEQCLILQLNENAMLGDVVIKNLVLHGRVHGRLGGIAIVHYNNTPSDQYSIIRSAKSRHIPFASDPIFKSPSDFIDSGDDFASSPCVFITRNGDSKSELLGLVWRSYWG
ncbi:hypothetical protein Syun_023538 [Stephania yunnanensis]|uniref:Uncharacterized protein n=1 Tax=Stephania yunnanensis TaxID=152371 RepID=A0AAP0FCH3_9MAGN